MFSCWNMERGELSEAKDLQAAMIAAWTHLTTDGETPPIVVCEGDNPEPLATFGFMPVGRGQVVRVLVAERMRS